MNSNKIVVDKHKVLAPLQQLPQPVKALYIAEHIAAQSWEELLQKPCVAIVGSRRPTAYGSQVTTQLARRLAAGGVVIVSGLALGIDSIAHQAALDNNGLTIAVLPSGIDAIYPASHYHLAKRIVDNGGLLVTEYPPGSGPPQKYQFIARNRIIAALGQTVIIPEAAKKSGSLHTAQFALEQGQDVLVVPGNITSPTSSGTNHLLKQGAIPITEPQDVLDYLGITATPQSTYRVANSGQAAILSLLKANIRIPAELLLRSKLEVGEFNEALTMLELNGVIANLGGTWHLR